MKAWELKRMVDTLPQNDEVDIIVVGSENPYDVKRVRRAHIGLVRLEVNLRHRPEVVE